MSFDEILDLTADVFSFYNIHTYVKGVPAECGCIEIPGVSQVEKGQHRTQAFLLVYEPM